MSDNEYKARAYRILYIIASINFRSTLRTEGIEKACENLKKEYKSHVLERVRMSDEDRTYLMLAEL